MPFGRTPCSKRPSRGMRNSCWRATTSTHWAMVTSGLDMDHSSAFSFIRGQQDLMLVAGVGWNAGSIGTVTISADAGTSTRSALSSGNTIVVHDIRALGHPILPSFVRSHGLLSGLEVAIP